MNTLTFRNPLAEFDAVRREMNGLLRSFDRAAGQAARPAGTSAGAAVPAVNTFESDDAVVLTAELPGLAPEDVEVSVLADEVTLSGSWPAAETPEGTHYLRRERPRGQFTRTLKLPFTPPADGVTAEFAAGVLTLTLNKPAETQPRKIEVKAR